MDRQLETHVRTPDTSEPDSSIEDTESPNRVPLHSVLQLNQRIGNRAVHRLLAGRGRTVQAKLTIGAADDHYEREAERVARQVTSTAVPTSGVTDQASVQWESPEKGKAAHTKPVSETITPLIQRAVCEPLPVRSARLQRKCACGGTPGADGLCEECRKKGRVEPADDFEARLNTAGEGSPLPTSTRAFMEPRFGADFSGIRLHTGSEAVQLNHAIGAQAFTQGQHIYLGEGKDNFEGSAGKQLLAHELTHSVQQVEAATREPTPHDTGVSEIVQSERKTGYIQRAGEFDIRGVNPQAAFATLDCFLRHRKRHDSSFGGCEDRCTRESTGTDLNAERHLQ
jgi:hypothetical protein